MLLTIGIDKELFVDHPVVAPHDPNDLVAMIGGGSYDRADAGIHAGGIPTAAKYSNFHYFVPKTGFVC